jgi:hypothetical protein
MSTHQTRSDRSLPPRADRRTALACLALLAAGCTSIGRHNADLLRSMEFGPPVEVRFCVLLDPGVSQQHAESLLQAWNEQEAPKYDLYVRAVSFESHERAGFTYQGILEGVRRVPLREECDRVVFFVGRHLGDTLYWVGALAANLASPIPILVPEVKGAVNGTGTHGFVVAELAHPDDLLAELFHGRKATTIHELYHFFGCGHSYAKMDECYRHIQELKEIHRRLRSEGYYDQVGEAPFFPSRRFADDMALTTRAQVNRLLQAAEPSEGADATGALASDPP